MNLIQEISEKFNILLDIKTFEPEKPTKETKERNQYYQKKDKTREVARMFKRRFGPFFNLNLKNNCIYTKNQFIDLLIYMSQTRDFAENGSHTYKELRGLSKPDADTLLYHLKSYHSSSDVHHLV